MPDDPDPSASRRFFWLRGAPAPRRQTLRRRYDALVIGGGLAGCSAALHLAAGGARAALLEGDRLAAGASGRNTGMLVAGYAPGPGQLLERFGAERAAISWQISLDAMALVHELTQRYGIDCALARSGSLYAAWDAEDMDELADELAARRAIGAGGELLDRAALQRRVQAPHLHGALFSPEDGMLNPAALVRGMADAAAACGADIREGARVTEVEEDAGLVRARYRSGQDEGELIAGHVILATNAYAQGGGEFGGALRHWLRRRLTPIRSFIMVTEPLSDAQQRDIGWRGGEILWDTRRSFNYLRMTADRRIMIGGRRMEAASDDDPVAGLDDAGGRLVSCLTEYFPSLAGLHAAAVWEGSFAITADLLPYVGPLPDTQRLLLALGFNGHGVAQAVLAGKHAAALLIGDDSPTLQACTDLFNPARPLPDEQPLIVRRLAVNKMNNHSRDERA